VFPTCEIFGSATIPAAATFWTPKRSEILDEGFGNFRDIWTILDVPVGETRRLIAEEQQLAELVDELATDETTFELLARSLERGDDDSRLSAEQHAVLDPYLADNESVPLEGLELGVAGLTHALSSVRLFPAASCRGHCGPHAWSDVPVVYVAADRFHSERLQPLLARAGCGFTIDDARPDLLVVGGRSIRDTMRLAQLVVEHRGDFKRPSTPRKSTAKTATTEQLPLFLQAGQVL
jgi:hypothetical protein